MEKITVKRGDTDFALWHWRSEVSSNADVPILHWAHATGFHGPTYAPLLAPLAKRFHVYAWDARGHGSSQPPHLPAVQKDWHGHCADLCAMIDVMRARHDGAPLILGGHSMGAAVSLLASDIMADKIAGLVLAEPVVITGFMHYRAAFLGLLPVRSSGNDMAVRARARKAHWDDIATLRVAYTGRGAFATWRREFLEAYLQHATHPDAGGGVRLACHPHWEALHYRAQGHDLVRVVKRLAMPFALLTAEHGSTNWALRHFEHRPQSKILIDGVGASHYLPMEQPDLVARAIEDLAALICA